MKTVRTERGLLAALWSGEQCTETELRLLRAHLLGVQLRVLHGNVPLTQSDFEVSDRVDDVISLRAVGWSKKNFNRNVYNMVKTSHRFNLVSTSVFIARQHSDADARYWYSNSVRLSVCPSVRLSDLSHSGVVSIRYGLTYHQYFLQHMVAQSFQFSHYETSLRNSDGYHPVYHGI